MNKKDFFERYTFNFSKDKLGGGSFGKVYKAYDTVLDKYIALKIAEQIEIDGRIFGLADEFKALAQLSDHPNIAKYEQLYSFEMQNGMYDYAVMQYYPNGNLSQLLKKVPLSMANKNEIATQLMDGIAYLHANDVVHRDLKPSNILIHNREQNGTIKYIPKITDFGLSKKANSKENIHFTNSIAAGTIAYSSPEQLQGNELMLNTDWWSFGAIVYEIFTGKVMFQGELNGTGYSEVEKQNIIDNIIRKDCSEKIAEVPNEWQKILTLCLQRDPQKRIKSVNEIKAFLPNYAATEVSGENEIDNEEITDDEVTKVLKQSKVNKSKKDIAKSEDTSLDTDKAPKKSIFSSWYTYVLPLLLGGTYLLFNFVIKPSMNSAVTKGIELWNKKDSHIVVNNINDSNSTSIYDQLTFEGKAQDTVKTINLEQLKSQIKKKNENANSRLARLLDGYKVKSAKSTNDVDISAMPNILGTYLFSSSWIDKELGGVTIKKENGYLKLKGEVEQGLSYVHLDGAIKILDKNSFQFDGMLASKMSNVNDGKVCTNFTTIKFIRDGVYFKNVQTIFVCAGFALENRLKIFIKG